MTDWQGNNTNINNPYLVISIIIILHFVEKVCETTETFLSAEKFTLLTREGIIYI